MHSFLKKTLSLSLALSLLAGAASAATLTGLETETVERSWESSLFFPRMEALTGGSMEAHAVSDETQYAAMLDAMAQGDIPADVLFKANLTRAQEQALLNGGALIDLAPLIEANMPNLSVLLAAHLGLNRFMEAVMRTRSRELLFLSTLGTCFGMALLTHSLGLSLSLGAFLAGLMLARSQYSMSVISGIMPYRDVFMSLFFISVGMMLDLSFFLQHIWAILFNTLLFILIKSLLTIPAVLVQGYPLRTAIQTSLCLAQVGEFSFVLAASGLAAGLLNDIGYQSFLALSVITMMLTPFLINLAPRAAALLTRGRGKEASSPEAEQQKASTLKDHLIIVGFGISGKHLAQVAKESGIPYTILEMNP